MQENSGNPESRKDTEGAGGKWQKRGVLIALLPIFNITKSRCRQGLSRGSLRNIFHGNAIVAFVVHAGAIFNQQYLG